jgi:hypothetical protein
VVQKLPVLESICPSESWAPNWRPGQRCDLPGQLVGAATAPRVVNGVLLVDTNTGSASFQFKARGEQAKHRKCRLSAEHGLPRTFRTLVEHFPFFVDSSKRCASLNALVLSGLWREGG